MTKRRSAALAVALLCASPTGASADELAACNGALVQGQELARAGKLVAARAAFPACLRAGCDEALRAVCANFVGDLQARIPLLQIDIRGPRGRVEGARAYVDGVLAADPSAPFEVDPGEHVIRVEAARYETKELRVVVAERERPHSLPIALSAVSETAASPSPSRLPASFYVLGAVSVLAVGSFAYFGIRGHETENDLRASCPTGPCDSGPMRREYLAADISLGVAVVAAGAALWIALARHRDASKQPASRRSFVDPSGRAAALLY